MSRRKEEAAVSGGIPEQDVAEYLRSHPDFFDRHPTVLLGLQLHHQPGQAATSLVERQVAMLRQRNGELESQLGDLVAVAKDNHVLVEKIHRLALALMAPADSEERLKIVRTRLEEDFAVECAVLILFAAPDAAPVDDRFVKVVDRGDPGLKPFARFLKSGRPHCGLLRPRQKSFVFGDGEVEIQSAALIPLGDRAELGFIVVGSRDPDHFHPGKGMDYLARLGEVVSMALSVSSREPSEAKSRSRPKASGS